MHKLSFPQHVMSSTSPLQLVHSDVWGPTPITSTFGYKYYVIFVYDYTRFTWLFLLKHKSEVFTVFLHFKAFVENQFESIIKILRTDDEGEYMSNQFKSFCLDHGIQHQLSCLYTPQQNGVAERKHKHIVESGLSMLYQSNFPSSYSCYAFSIAIYLINRLPSSVLALKSPWGLLFHSIPPLSSLKAFGCACFPLLKPYTDHKLQPKSTQCIFLGYPPLSKGYICFDPHSHKVYITPHVIFNESDLPTIPTGQSDSSSSSFSVHLPLDLWISNLFSGSSPSSFSDVSDALSFVSSSFPVSHQSSDISITSTDVPLPSSSPVTSSSPAASLSHTEISNQLPSPLPPYTFAIASRFPFQAQSICSCEKLSSRRTTYLCYCF